MREQLVQSRATMSRLRGRNQNVLQLVAELEHMVDIRGLGMGGQQLAGQGNDGHFDALEFEEFNELQTLSRQLTEAATDAREIGVEGDVQLVRFSDLIEENHRWQVQSQDLVMRTRMTPVSSIEPRLQRSVRQTSRLLDKDVTLELIGGHTLMDSHVLQALVDPLMHVLRNSIDHGLEMPDVREALGKPRTGLLRLSFSREGNSIVVRCRDDGNGLDHQAIRSKAEALGIVTSDQLLSHDEVARLILRHGFSTRDAASQISGRGIGMDAVLAAIYALKGTLFLHSEHGQGLTVELRLPVSLVASHALMVVSASQVYALSTGGIQDLLYLDVADVEVASDGQMKAKVSDQWLPMVDFEQLIGAPATPDEGRNGFPVLVVQLDTGDLEAIRVQAVRASRDIVVKDMGRFVPRLAGLLGATVLGDGDVVPVIDLRELATMAHGGGLRAANTANTLLSDELGVKTTTVLVVDDSLTARRNTAQFMRDAGFEVRTATDGLDAVTMMERWVPDIILTDMEMPRMNGLELASLVRSDAKLVHVPIVMITSRSTEKHRRQASKSGVNSYFVKPFNEDVMLDSVMELTQKQSKTTDARAPSGSSME
jgi:chemosensory pili system protein ChpA (sensor histidine kinase/response regulator)